MDGCVVQVRLGHGQGSFFLLYLSESLRDLGVRRGNARHRRVVIGSRQIELLLAHHGSFDQADRTFVVRLGLNLRCLGFFQIGSCRGHVGLGVGEVAFGLQHSAME